MPDFEEIVLGRAKRGKKSALLAALLVFVVYFALYQGPATGYWDTYISVPASLIAGEPIDFRSDDGSQAYAGAIEGRLPDDLVRPDSFGVATKDQRIGAAIQAAPFFRLFRVFGFRLLYALIPALTAMLFFLVVQQLTGRRWIGLVTSLGLVLNPFLLSFQSLNANFPALMLLVAILLMLQFEPFRPLVAGLLLGVLGGIRNMGVIYAPLFILWVYFLSADRSESKKSLPRRLAGLRGAGLFVIGALLTILPITYWKEFAFGSPFAHPSQFADFQGFRPTFEHTFFGLKFFFNGLLNFPFHSQWVRTPHFPFPVFLMIPLVFTTSIGLIGVGLGFLGLKPLMREHRRTAWMALAWLTITCIFWAFQENWEELKMSFLFLAMPPIFLFVSFGIGRLTAIGELRGNILALATIAVILIVVTKFAFFLEFPQDDRWYERFPKAGTNVSQLSGLPEHKRLSPEFFLTRETDEERLATKKRLTSICFFPCQYLPLQTRWTTIGTTVEQELEQPRLVVGDVWDKIYAQQQAPNDEP
jgi:hypothetical protein